MSEVEELIKNTYNVQDYPVAILIDKDGGVQVFGREKVVALKLCSGEKPHPCLEFYGHSDFVNYFAVLVGEKIEVKPEAMREEGS